MHYFRRRRVEIDAIKTNEGDTWEWKISTTTTKSTDGSQHANAYTCPRSRHQYGKWKMKQKQETQIDVSKGKQTSENCTTSELRKMYSKWIPMQLYLYICRQSGECAESSHDNLRKHHPDHSEFINMQYHGQINKLCVYEHKHKKSRIHYRKTKLSEKGKRSKNLHKYFLRWLNTILNDLRRSCIRLKFPDIPYMKTDCDYRA